MWPSREGMGEHGRLVYTCGIARVTKHLKDLMSSAERHPRELCQVMERLVAAALSLGRENLR